MIELKLSHLLLSSDLTTDAAYVIVRLRPLAWHHRALYLRQLRSRCLAIQLSSKFNEPPSPPKSVQCLVHPSSTTSQTCATFVPRLAPREIANLRLQLPVPPDSVWLDVMGQIAEHASGSLWKSGVVILTEGGDPLKGSERKLASSSELVVQIDYIKVMICRYRTWRCSLVNTWLPGTMLWCCARRYIGPPRFHRLLVGDDRAKRSSQLPPKTKACNAR